MTRVAVNGAAGRMGQRILALAAESGEYEIAGRFDAKADAAGRIERLSTESLGNAGGVLIDFSSPAGTETARQACLKAGWGLVVGTTGLDAKAAHALEEASLQIPVVFSSNMSVGINVVAQLLEAAAQKLPADFDIEITEAHHRHKKDSPSGTALLLARVIAMAKGWDLARALRYRTEGKTEQDRGRQEIGMQVIRAGEIVGDHTVLFAGPAETIEITHRAQSRDTFARGALLAARFAAQARPGRLYSMTDVLRST